MTKWTRRAFLAAVGVTTAGCGNGIGNNAGQRIDYRIDLALTQMYDEVPGTRDLADRAAGMLVMPNVTEAGFGIGGSYGEGALMIGGAAVDYYSAAQASYGLQIGAQQYAHTLFFMNETALSDFRASNGWSLGADASYVIRDRGDNVGIDTTKLRSPVVAAIYGRAGLIVGATLEGNKYSRIIR